MIKRERKKVNKKVLITRIPAIVGMGFCGLIVIFFAIFSIGYGWEPFVTGLAVAIAGMVVSCIPYGISQIIENSGNPNRSADGVQYQHGNSNYAKKPDTRSIVCPICGNSTSYHNGTNYCEYCGTKINIEW